MGIELCGLQKPGWVAFLSYYLSSLFLPCFFMTYASKAFSQRMHDHLDHLRMLDGSTKLCRRIDRIGTRTDVASNNHFFDKLRETILLKVRVRIHLLPTAQVSCARIFEREIHFFFFSCEDIFSSVTIL
jgi:hypothetical protein